MRLVRPRREGRLIFYTLDDDHIVRLFEQGLEHVLENKAPAARSNDAGRGTREGSGAGSGAPGQGKE
jgi:hypothetical protein